ncbi:MAG: DUF1501 domain-containing protein, partial [Fuerstiella sp.]|nr:DUF1501 domain-containing protein [Fuerstiella sp.]
RSYQLSERMQAVVPQVTDLKGELPAPHDLYGTVAEPTLDFGRSCLLARLSCHCPSSVGHQSRTVDVLSQWHRASTDECSRRSPS